MDEGWMSIISSSFHPELSFRIHLIFILVATVVATFYHSPKKEKAVFFLFPLNFSSSVFLFVHGFLSFLIKFFALVDSTTLPYANNFQLSFDFLIRF